MKNTCPLSIENLSIRVGNKLLFENFSLRIEPHQFVSLMGENGVGKTCLLETLCGLRKVAHGKVSFWGKLLSEYDNRDFYSQVGWVTSSPETYPLGLKVGELFLLLASVYPTWNSKLAQDLCESFRLSPEKRLAHLSLGEHSKVRLIKGISFEPKLLLLDELTANLSPESKTAVLSALLDIFSRTDMAVLYVCHSKDEATRLSDRIVTL